MKYYAVLDTNVLVSAMLRTGSVPGRVAAEAMNGDIIPVLNDDILEEYEDVLRRPKFGFDDRAVRVFLDELKRRAVYTDHVQKGSYAEERCAELGLKVYKSSTSGVLRLSLFCSLSAAVYSGLYDMSAVTFLLLERMNAKDLCSCKGFFLRYTSP